MRRAARMNVDDRAEFCEAPGRAGVIEMDMAEKNMADLFRLSADASELGHDVFESRFGSGIEERDAFLGFERRRSNHTRSSELSRIENVNHWKFAFALSRHLAEKKIMSALRILALLLASIAISFSADYPQPAESDYVIQDFKFASGESLPELRIHYRTIGKPDADAHGEIHNAVLITHGTTGSGAQFVRPEFAGELFGAGQPLDAAKFFIILPDGIGHGKSSRPSEGMHAKFPRYGYRDMVEAQYQLLSEGLGIKHARLIMGTSMGGMHTWLWGERHPDFMDALMPLASLPTQISGRNRGWRRMISDAIRSDPSWENGDYKMPPQSLRTAAEMLWFMSSNPILRQTEAPTLDKTDEALDKFVADYMKTGDANDVLYAIEASRDYDPGPNLEKIRAPLLAINSADDLINPPELGILEREIKRVPHGRAIVIPLSDKTRGHGSHTIASLWKDELVKLLDETTTR